MKRPSGKVKFGILYAPPEVKLQAHISVDEAGFKAIRRAIDSQIEPRPRPLYTALEDLVEACEQWNEHADKATDPIAMRVEQARAAIKLATRP